MRKRSAMELPANDDVIKAYHELKRLREDVDRIERSSTLPAGQMSAAGRDAPKGDDDVQEILRSRI